jgi:hypothetical protein
LISLSAIICLNDLAVIDFVLSVLVEFATERAAAVREVVAITLAGMFPVLAFVHPFVSGEVSGAAAAALGLVQVRFRVPLQHPPGAARSAAAVGFHRE